MKNPQPLCLAEPFPFLWFVHFHRCVHYFQGQDLQHWGDRGREAEAAVGAHAQERGGVGVCAHQHGGQLHAAQPMWVARRGLIAGYFSALCLSVLTPSLPQPVKFPGWKMHGRAGKQYIFWSYNTSTFNVYVLMKGLLHDASAKKKTGWLKGFKFRTFIGHFKVTSWQRWG